MSKALEATVPWRGAGRPPGRWKGLQDTPRKLSLGRVTGPARQVCFRAGGGQAGTRPQDAWRGAWRRAGTEAGEEESWAERRKEKTRGALSERFQGGVSPEDSWAQRMPVPALLASDEGAGWTYLPERQAEARRQVGPRPGSCVTSPMCQVPLEVTCICCHQWPPTSQCDDVCVCDPRGWSEVFGQELGP